MLKFFKKNLHVLFFTQKAHLKRLTPKKFKKSILMDHPKTQLLLFLHNLSITSFILLQQMAVIRKQGNNRIRCLKQIYFWIWFELQMIFRIRAYIFGLNHCSRPVYNSVANCKHGMV